MRSSELQGMEPCCVLNLMQLYLHRRSGGAWVSSPCCLRGPSSSDMAQECSVHS